jgi:dTDP-4-dehydrorhamnose 3,5-epimerase
MRILTVEPLPLGDAKVIRYKRFTDNRGYFAETYHKTDFSLLFRESFNTPRDFAFRQVNVSRSSAKVVRGLHFQWDPPMGKLVRAVSGSLGDIVLDIRIGSPTFGKACIYPLSNEPEESFGEWLFIPPGFAHGFFTPRGAEIEYFCTAEYNPEGEAGISPLSGDIDWSLADAALLSDFKTILSGGAIMSEKDAKAPELAGWLADPRSASFAFSSPSR